MSFETCIKGFYFSRQMKSMGFSVILFLAPLSFIVFKYNNTGLEHVNDDRIKMFGVEMTFNNTLVNIAFIFIRKKQSTHNMT